MADPRHATDSGIAPPTEMSTNAVSDSDFCGCLCHPGKDSETPFSNLPSQSRIYGEGELQWGWVDQRPEQTPHPCQWVNANGVTILLNGCLDNLDELADRYLRWTLPNEPSPEGVLQRVPYLLGQLYDQMGLGFLERLRGFFSLAVWDPSEQSFLLARSASGQRPLFHATWGERLFFSTSLRALARLGNRLTELEPRSLCAYLVLGGVPAPDTIYHNVFAVPSGTWLRFRPSGVESGRFWDVPPLKRWSIGISEAEKLLQEKISDAVSLALKPISRVGCLLSGSLNSSAIVFFARRFQRKGQSLATYTLARRYSSWREFRIASQVADLCRAQHISVGLSTDPINTALALAACLDAPSAEPSHLRSFLMMSSPQITADGLLAGFGGDEILAGRPYHAMLNVPRSLRLFPHFIRCFFVENGFGEHGIPRTPEDAYQFSTQKFSLEQVQSLLGCDAPLPSFSHDSKEASPDLLRRFLDRDVLHRLPDLMLPALDCFSRSAGRVLRLPFLDQEVVELACLLPKQYILNGLTTKFLLRRVLQSQMPPRVLHQMARSKDFLFRRWIDADLKELIFDTLSSARSLSTTVFSRDAIAKVLSRHESGEARSWHLIWSLLILELWYRNQTG